MYKYHFRDPKDYVHRVGRTARAGRGGLAISLITQNDVELIHKIEEDLGKQMEEFKCKENEVLENITKVRFKMALFRITEKRREKFKNVTF